MSSHSNNDESMEIIDQRDTLRSIQNDLETLEGQLNGRPLQSSMMTRPAAGRAVFESIGTALGSIRSRLSGVERQSRRMSVENTQTTDGLEERLRNAERAHSSRIPLSMLQRELSRRRDSERSFLSDKDEQEQSAGAAHRRRSSVLLASRRLAEAAVGHQADMDLHGAGVPLMPPATKTEEETTEEPTDMLSPVKEAENEDKSSEFMISPEKGSEHEEPSEHVEAMLVDDEDHKDDVLPVLLTRNSISNLDTARRSILFHKTEAVKSFVSTSDTVVYSWGSGVNSLHEDNEERSIERALVKPDSRIGRSDIVSAAAGPNHAACSVASGEVLVCGHNVSGVVDPDRKIGDVVARPVPLESLPAMSRIVQVSCGLDHTAAVRSNGTVLTWGSNEFGQLGHRLPFSKSDDKPTASIRRPAMMMLGSGHRATTVSCGDGFTLVLTSRMGVLACGVKSIAGHSKDEKDFHPAAPIPALEDLPIVSVAAGKRHAVAVTAHGSAFTWGENSHGCLGREYPKSTSVPVPVRVESGLSPPSGSTLPEPLSHWAYWEGESGHVSIAHDIAVVDVACGDEHTVLLTRSGRLLVCGNNSNGQLGMDPASNKAIHHVAPIHHPNVSKGRSFVRVEAGEVHTILLDDSGDVWQLGDGHSAPLRLLEGKSIQWIAAGGKQNIAVAAVPGHRLPSHELSDDNSAEGVDLAHSVEDLLAALADEMETGDSDDKPLNAVEKELVTRTEELLKAPAVLNSLFLDPTELEELFDKLLSTDSAHLKRSLVSAIEKGMQKGLESVQSDHPRLMYPEQVRFLLLYVQCPLFLDWKDAVDFDHRGELIWLLCETILALSYEGYRALLSWATSVYTKETFSRLLVRPLVGQLEKCLSVSAGALRRPIPAIVAVLRWLYNAGEREDIVLPEDFHCKAVADSNPRWIVEDLIRYKEADEHERASHFFLCDNAFLFSPSTKRILLQIESEMNMLSTAAQEVTYNFEERQYEFDPFYVVEIEREHLLEQTLEKIKKAEANDLRKKLRIVFKGEEGIDAGGVTREYFQLLSAQLFDVTSGMWTDKYEGITWFNSDCTWNDEGFYLVGILVGLAVYNGVLLDVHFPHAVYRMLLGESLGLEDVVDEEVKKGFQQLLDYEGDDVEDIFCLTFEVTWMDLGEEKKRELKPGGSNLPVTSDNREEYVMLYVKWLLVDSIYPQYEAFERGFMRVMEDSSLEMLRPEDLELLVVGSPELDFEALEKNTTYEGGYDAESAVVQNFWRFVKNADRDTQVMLLKFTTGSPKAPIGGLGELPFKIQKAGPDSMQLPSSHTCFNTLLLPDYGDNYEKLEERLGRAIVECEGFGLQ